jgi:hypothetical protein
MFADLNPNREGFANIDDINDVREEFDDPLGLNSNKITKYLQADAFSDNLVDEMLEFIVEFMRTPKPHQ